MSEYVKKMQRDPTQGPYKTVVLKGRTLTELEGMAKVLNDWATTFPM